ncbi:M64 family metallopeptidase [Umezawaea sp. Da 62-37]|uniref:M64 family metallopeptidase n=1 Tax=Umezawaea sp. Da 62-37 TaxID=3075927 RepID=UPI0028F6F10B|nr:M64 family metallopeptidase [Umezawaea sp. Da 62-37]WNV91026.1 M64 family metallopeptidase [Umezawaea sp. Da 62-37]
MRSTRLILPALAVGFVVVVAPLPTTAAPAAVAVPAPTSSTVVREAFSPDGTISKVVVAAPKATVQPRSKTSARARTEVVTIQNTGATDQRFDLVFVGDGYTKSEQALFHQHALNKWAELSAVEPFASYKDYFNVWQVNAVSVDSGVDDNPQGNDDKRTALDMGFWCKGAAPTTERLLCVNEEEAYNFAALAPAADQIIALGNTTKYGGAGGGVATAAGGNAQAGQIVVHELGHSIGGLADEYFSPGTYTGSEPAEINASKLADGSKWAQYLGQPSPDGGVVGVFEGSKYYGTGLYRPTENSIMRTLGRQYSLVGRDAMVQAFKTKIPELQN